jgi:YidC/Oxa1 family membrane protein insertase
VDRRTVLAFALIFLVYFAWMELSQHLYPPREPTSAAPPDTIIAEAGPAERPTPGGQKPAAQAGQSAANPFQEGTPATSPPQQAPPASADFLAPAGPLPSPVVLHVRTPLYEAEISTLGGHIVSWRALGVPGANRTGPVQLIPEQTEQPDSGGAGSDDQNDWQDALAFSHRLWDIDSLPFALEGPTDLVLQSGDGPRSVVLSHEVQGGLRLERVLTFRADRYDVEIVHRLQTVAADRAAEALASLGEPAGVRLAWARGIASTERNEAMEERSFRSFAMVGEELVTRREQSLRKGVSAVEADLRGSIRFAGLQNRYFEIAGLLPTEADEVIEGRILLGGIPAENRLTWAIETPLHPGSARSGYVSPQLLLYLGPSKFEILKSYGVGLEQTVDLGWKLFRPLAEVILAFMTWLYGWIPNYGVVIILLSVLSKLLFYPLTRTSTRSMRKMQALQPKLKALQEKYKNNREKLSQETMKLYQKEKVNPMAGCLPMIVQAPVFIALYQVLRSTIALRQAPFVLWINDLAQQDALFQLGFTLPFIGDSFNVLPILMAAAMYFQTKMTPTPAGGGQMAMFNTLMPVMMLVFFYKLPSGLVLYWLVNNIMTIYQTWRIQRTTPVPGGEPAT